jgi:uncharacterized protein (TIGR00251 family)
MTHEPPDWLVAIRPLGEEAICIELRVEPASSRPRVGPYDPWRQRVKVRVSAPAVSGKANRELIHQIADAFGVPASSVTIVRGATTRRKSVQVTGVTLETAQRVLGDLLADTED